MRRASEHVPLLLGVLFLALLAVPQRWRIISVQNDFTALYVAAHLAGTPDLYSRPANLRLTRSLHGLTMESVVYTRPPFYAALLSPLARLPLRAAYAVFAALSLAAFLWFVWRFARECPSLPCFAAFSVPAVASLSNGQDTLLLVALVGASVLLVRRGREFTAGGVLALCAIKPHLFVLVPLLLLAQRRWQLLLGGAAGTTLLTALGAGVNGAASLPAWIAVLRDPWINPDASVMPNLHGLVAALSGGPRLEAALVAGVVLAFAWAVHRARSFEFLLGVALLGGLLVSYHSAIMDDALLFPVFVLFLGTSTHVPLRVLSALVLTPLPYFALLAQVPPYSAALPTTLLVLLVVACVSLRHREPLTPPTAHD